MRPRGDGERPGSDYGALETNTPVGTLTLVASSGALRAVLWPGDVDRIRLPHGIPHVPDDPLLRDAATQLDEYFEGSRRTFDLPLHLDGTPFQRSVWEALADIPYGCTLSYGALAASLGRPAAARAVGAANRLNPVSIVRPCHRVVGRDGALVGFAGGTDTKRWLLEHERRQAS